MAAFADELFNPTTLSHWTPNFPEKPKQYFFLIGGPGDPLFTGGHKLINF
jgi:hypothetical protein